MLMALRRRMRQICGHLEENHRTDTKLLVSNDVGKLGLRDLGLDLGRTTGLLQLPLGHDWQILFFRDEDIRPVKWGGDPRPESDDSPGPLTPRASFDVFVETVRGKSRRWTQLDIAVCEQMHASLIGFVVRRNEQIARLNLELVSKNEEIQQFAFSISHDLKSPLVTVNGYIQCIEEDFEAGEMGEVKHALKRTKKAIQKMGTLIDDLLTFSRIGRHGHTASWFSTGKIISGIVQQFEHLAEERQIKFVRPDEKFKMFGMQQDISRALQNLVDNAFKNLGEDNSEPRIEIGVEDHKSETVLWVADNGVGIAEEHHKRIFRLFQRLDSSTDGSGIGLASVEKLMSQHEGKVELISSAGNGAKFSLHFPKPF